MKKILLSVLVLMLASCASTTQFTKFPDTNSVNKEKARIYVIRESIYGSAIPMKVYQDDKLIGKLGPKSYLFWEVNEGEIRLKSAAENKDYFTINAKAGKTYYIKQKIMTGVVAARSLLELMDENEAIVAISKLKKPKVNYAE